MDAPILTLEEAAALLRVSPDWLRKSTCPRLRVGGVVRWDREAIVAWMRAHSTVEVAA
jgi:predicted DNA-binding transcriptional regulator AlpA